MTQWLIPVLVGFATGILSSFGVGGGTLLLLIMTLFLGVDYATAQTINLLYFLPTAALSLALHRKNGYISAPVAKVCIPWGAAFAVLGALLAENADVWLLKKLFGAFLIYAGASLIFSKKRGG
jgi:uncharacterized membrane protein YfcA